MIHNDLSAIYEHKHTYRIGGGTGGAGGAVAPPKFGQGGHCPPTFKET